MSTVSTRTALSVNTFLDFCRQHQAEMLALLQRMVEIESPSDNKAAVDRMGEFLAREFERIGGQVTIYPQETAGNHLKAEFGAGAPEPRRVCAGWGEGGPGKPVLLLGHFDTVWSMGTLAGMPFRIDAGRAYGPGVYDMKAGITMMIFAVRALQEAGAAHRPAARRAR